MSKKDSGKGRGNGHRNRNSGGHEGEYYVLGPKPKDDYHVIGPVPLEDNEEVEPGMHCLADVELAAGSTRAELAKGPAETLSVGHNLLSKSSKGRGGGCDSR
jgi:hypothetical protein